ncbi:WD40 repeat domain-containing protein [Plasticicumulans sp.]|uniref:WD40 repeat domain-containing protein n=1 Tax=Plasticicumulans sp. TaxID=2307179 RepID=UPI0039270ECB
MDGSARLWDAASGRELRRFEGHGAWVLSVAFAPSGGQVLTGGMDGRARLWDAASGRELRCLEGHGGAVNSVAFAPSGGQVLTGGADGSARLWDVETGACLLRLYGFDDKGFDEPGWLSLDTQDRYCGNAAGIAQLSYVDPDDLSLMPTHWHPEDLPYMEAPDPEAPGGD